MRLAALLYLAALGAAAPIPVLSYPGLHTNNGTVALKPEPVLPKSDGDARFPEPGREPTSAGHRPMEVTCSPKSGMSCGLVPKIPKLQPPTTPYPLAVKCDATAPGRPCTLEPKPEPKPETKPPVAKKCWYIFPWSRCILAPSHWRIASITTFHPRVLPGPLPANEVVGLPRVKDHPPVIYHTSSPREKAEE